MSNDYYDDEWYEEDNHDEDYEPTLVYHEVYLGRSPRGSLYIEVISAYDYSRYPPSNSENWDWHTERYSLRAALTDYGYEKAVAYGKSMESGTAVSWSEVDPPVEDEDEDTTDIDDIPF